MKYPRSQQTNSCGSSCECNSDLGRRQFLQVAGIGAASAGLSQSMAVMAGPFSTEDQAEHLIPAEKRLASDWLASLTQRGVPETYQGDQLRYIGMPVGGICCGQLYLGGDGRLWLWDIFQSQYQSDYGGMSMGTHYAHPPEPDNPQRYHPTEVAQGFAIRVKVEGADDQVRTLDRDGFAEISFRGEYPIGRVTYRDKQCPVEVELEAFSPFIPLNAADSALPATIMSFTVRNLSQQPAKVEIMGHLQNTVCPDFESAHLGQRVSRLHQQEGLSTVLMTAKPPQEHVQEQREDILYANFETEEYEGWQAEGTAFGEGPFPKAKMKDYHNVLGHEGKQLVNSHNTRNGETVGEGDQHTGKLTSDAFKIQRKYINFKIGGGRHPGKTCLNLVVDGKVVRTATGHDANPMRAESFDVAELEGAEATLQIVDSVKGAWGNIGVDHVVFSDSPAKSTKLTDLPGYGSMALSLLGGEAFCQADIEAKQLGTKQVFDNLFEKEDLLVGAEMPLNRKPISGLGTQISLAGEATQSVDFVLSWHFPNYPSAQGEFAAIENLKNLKRHYAAKFKNAASVAGYIAEHFDRLAGQTRLWNKTWYDSTLPYWLLDRAFVSLDCLATQTCHWFDSGRFYGWEGVSCCPGTCQHVWNYAQGLARIFPELERTTREHIDYGIAFQESGELWYRAESGRHIAHDGQCGTIVRAYREHTTAADDSYLQRIWPKIRQSIQYLIDQDGSKDGLLEGRQYNTLDQAWYGPMGWISSMYLAAVAAGEKMAIEMKDSAFAKQCAKILKAGRKNLVGELYNGEYFIHKPPNLKATNTNNGCHIDQVFGQSLAWQVGLPRVVSKPETDSALGAIWKYNFTLDAGGYRNAMQDSIKGGRWYAMPGEAGLLMSTWPTGGANLASGKGDGIFAVGVGYFNECMNGFEYQAASHMIYEGQPGSGLVTKGLAVTRAVHDRYAPNNRNPYNEVECSDHYSRSMASYGVFLSTCGFEYHGPTGHLGFSPKLSPNKFKAAFTAAEGWGSYQQQLNDDGFRAKIELKFGKLKLSTLSISLPGNVQANAIKSVTINGNSAKFSLDDSGLPATKVLVNLDKSLTFKAGESIDLEVLK